MAENVRHVRVETKQKPTNSHSSVYPMKRGLPTDLNPIDISHYHLVDDVIHDGKGLVYISIKR